MDHHLTWIDQLIARPGLPGSYALLSENPSSDTAVIFFHGFLGDAHSTWLNFQSMIDSYSIAYPEWDRSDLYFIQYPSFRKSVSQIARLVLKVTDVVFPNPPATVFKIDHPVKGVPENVIQLSLAEHSYTRLILIGHSEGAAILRRAVEVAFKNKELTSKLGIAQMNLFAPAHLGFEPKGWIGACLSIARIEQVALTALRWSPAFVEMKEKTALLNTAQNTNRYADESPDYKGLRARVLIGEHDNFVARGEFARDTILDDELGQDHTSICKPRADYAKPLSFAQGN